MANFFNIYVFGPFLAQKKFFSKIRLCHAQLHLGFQHHTKIQKKLKIQFQENARTDRRTEGWKDGRKERRTDRPNFIGPYRLTPGVQLHLFDNFWTFKTQNTECSYIHVENWIYKKLKEAVEICKNQTKNHSVLAKIYKAYYMYS